MEKRYTQLMSVEVDYDLIGCDVEFVKGNILRDNNDRRVLAQLKFRNLSSKVLKAMHIKLTQFDEMGTCLDEKPIEFAYQDLNCSRGAEFGDKSPVYLNDSRTRRIQIVIDKYLLDDDSVISCDSFDKYYFNEKQTEIPNELRNLAQCKCGTQFEIKSFPKVVANGWLCACGKYNTNVDCIRCGSNKDRLMQDLRLDALTDAQRNIDKENVEKQKQDIKNRKAKNKKRNKVIIVLSIVAIFVFVATIGGAYFIDYTNEQKNEKKYQEALQLKNEKKYQEAMGGFTGIMDYKDSLHQYNLCSNYYYLDLAREAVATNDIDEIKNCIDRIDDSFNEEDYIKLKENLIKYDMVAKKWLGTWRNIKDSSDKFEITASINTRGCYLIGVGEIGQYSVDDIENGAVESYNLNFSKNKKRYEINSSCTKIKCTISYGSSLGSSLVYTETYVKE